MYENDFDLFKSIKPLELEIKKIVYCNIQASFEIVDSREEYNKRLIRNEFNRKNKYPVREIAFASDSAEISKLIGDFELKNKLEDYFKYENKSRWRTIQYYRKDFKLGFYFAEVGYRRKGVNNKFWKYFDRKSNLHYFTDKSDFLNVYKCIDKCWGSDTKEAVQKRKIDFKLNFLDNFEYGKSFLVLSY